MKEGYRQRVSVHSDVSSFALASPVGRIGPHSFDLNDPSSTEV